MVSTIESKAMDFSEVSALLWRERETLDLLLFKLVEEQLIMSSGQTRWLSRADREIEAVLNELRTTEVLRALEVDGLADELGLPASPSLSLLAEVAPAPWDTLLNEHRQALIIAIGAIEQVKNGNRALIVAGTRAVRETMLSVSDSVDTYDARGQAAAPTHRALLMDEQA
jgi:FlgN protein